MTNPHNFTGRSGAHHVSNLIQTGALPPGTHITADKLRSVLKIEDIDLIHEVVRYLPGASGGLAFRPGAGVYVAELSDCRYIALQPGDTASQEFANDTDQELLVTGPGSSVNVVKRSSGKTERFPMWVSVLAGTVNAAKMKPFV